MISNKIQRIGQECIGRNPNGETSACISRTITIRVPEQSYSDCYIYASVKLFVQTISVVLNDPVLNANHANVCREPATFKSVFGVDTINTSSLHFDLQKWGHLANVLQKYMRKYFSSDFGITLNILIEISRKLNEMSSSYNSASEILDKKRIITDFLEFKDPVCRNILQKQEELRSKNNELTTRLHNLTLKLGGIIGLIPDYYANIMNTIVRNLNQYNTLLNRASQLRNMLQMADTSKNTQIASVTGEAATVQSNLDKMLTDAITLLTKLNPDHTNLIYLLIDLKTIVTTLLPNIMQSQESYGLVTQSESVAVIPIFESLFPLLNPYGLQLEVNPNISKIRLDQNERYSNFSHELSQSERFNLTNMETQTPEFVKFLQLSKVLLLKNYAQLSIRASNEWFKKFSEVHRNAESVDKHTTFPTICPSTDPNIFISDADADLLFRSSNKNAHDISGHAVAIKGIKIIMGDIYLLIENSWGPEWTACWINIKVFGTFVESGQPSCLMTSHYSINVVCATARAMSQVVDTNEIDVSDITRKRDVADQAACANSCEERIVTALDLDDNSFGFESDLSKMSRFSVDDQTLIKQLFAKYDLEAVELSRSAIGGSTRRRRQKTRLRTTRKQCKPKQNVNNRRRTKTAKMQKNRKNKKNALRKTRKSF